MCGIFGWSFSPGSVSPARRGILAVTLARLNDDRGGHSWGLLGLDGAEVTIERGMGDLYPESYRLTEYDTVYGHTRYATTGEKTTANAHPFEIGNVVGAHNGMVFNHSDLNEQYGRAFAVDSMHLFAHLSEGLPMDEISGYGAIEWYDRDNPGRVYLSRMTSGELAVYGIGTGPDDCQGVIWTSDETHMLEALECAGVRTFEYNVKEGVIYFVENHKLYLSDRRVDLMERVSVNALDAAKALTSGKGDDLVYSWERGEEDPLLWNEKDPWDEYQRQAIEDLTAAGCDEVSGVKDDDDLDTPDEQAFREWFRDRSSQS